MISSDQERWAEALAIVRMHGDRAEAFIEDRMVALADDDAGLSRWRQIADRLGQLRKAADQSRH